ncbi:MAG: tubulin-like doman-containing protein [Ktedonobacteraceae bacterium]
MADRKSGKIDVAKAIMNVSLAAVAAGAAASGNIPLAAILTIPVAASQTIGPFLEGSRAKQNKPLEFPVPNWWTESDPAWQKLCIEIENHLPDILNSMEKRLQTEQNVATPVVQRAFIEATVDVLAWEADRQQRIRVAEYIAPYLSQSMAAIFKAFVDPIRQEKALGHIFDTSVKSAETSENTREIAELLKKLIELIQKSPEEIQKQREYNGTLLSTGQQGIKQVPPVFDKPMQTIASTVATYQSNASKVNFTVKEEHPWLTTEPRITTPSIIIFLGSTPMLAALELMRHMLTLNQKDIRRVALVYIDTDNWTSAFVKFRHQHNDVFYEFPIRIAVPTSIAHIERRYQPVCYPYSDPQDDKLELHTFIKGKEPQYFANGAGGIRNNGHVAACFHHQEIYETLDRALVTVSRVDKGESRINELQVNIVSFLGGGTGSGILPDIVVMARDLLTNYQYRQRINLFCTLPERVKGASTTDISWRKSNATACLLELLAFGAAAGATPSGIYEKRMRDKVYRLTNDPFTNEIYLIGQAPMDDITETARIVGLDLFQRITDASGVGFLEHSKWVDRRTPGETDDRGLPAVFGTSCPLEVRFPAAETADAFAHVAASHLLPFLTSYQPQSIVVRDNNKRDWTREWNDVARIEANANDLNAIKPGQLSYDEFVRADQRQLDMLWSKLERYERETEFRIREVVMLKQKEELRHIDQGQDDMTNPISLHIQHLQHLQREYAFALKMLASRNAPSIPARPTDAETDLIRSKDLLFRLKSLGHNHSHDIYLVYNEHMDRHARAVRHLQLIYTLEELLQTVQEKLNSGLAWIEEMRIENNTQELETVGLTSMAWQGHLENPHPHQRHIFDLRTLYSSDGRNIAVERFYLWATGGNKTLTEGTPIEYEAYVSRCVDYLARSRNDTRNNKQEEIVIEGQSEKRLADYVVDFFRDYYTKLFRDMNLFDLLEKAALQSQRGYQQTRQISNYLLEHLQHIHDLISNSVSVTFEADMWVRESSTPDTSIYLGMHWRDSYQRNILDQALDTLKSITSDGQLPAVEAAIDPHRLQIVYGQHANSLSTVRDFYLDQNSSMEAYMVHQKKWEDAGGFLFGLMPVHSSSEAQWLVREGKTLGYMPPTPLFMRIIRKPFKG